MISYCDNCKAYIKTYVEKHDREFTVKCYKCKHDVFNEFVYEINKIENKLHNGKSNE